KNLVVSAYVSLTVQIASRDTVQLVRARPAHNIELMRKIRAHVMPGARLLLVDLWTDPSHSQPSAAALMSGQFLLTSGEGQVYSEQEADEACANQMKKLERKTLAGPASCIIAEAT